MADDVQLNTAAGSPGDTIAADDIGGVKHQRVKVQYGADGSATDVSETTPLPVLAGDVVSSDNTTTSTLSGGATYTGTGEVAPSDGVAVSCYADVAGTLYFDFSVNGTDWRTFPTAGFSVAAGIHEYHTAKVNGRYFRARYVNGAAAQSTFQLYTYFGPHTQPNAPLNQPVGLDADSTLVRPTYTWMDISRGLSSGVSVVKKFGRNAAVATTFVPVCLGAVYRTPQAASATTLRVAAGNTNDTSGGSGAREITLEGLDENFELASEAVATAGTSASSATSTTFTRLFRAYVSSSGTYASATAGSHAAAIVIENGAGGTTWATIDATDFPKSQSEIGAYTIPSGYTGYVFLKNISVDSGKVVDSVFFSRSGCDEAAVPYSAMRARSVNTGITAGVSDLSGSLIPYGPFTGPTDIGFMAKGASTPAVSVEFDIFLVAE